MKVLSIDLDYIMGPVIEIYQSLRWDDNPTMRWKMLYETSDFKESNFYIDQAALLFCYDTFLKSLKNAKTVSFGYEHDAILYEIGDSKNLDIVNIDHHDDIFHIYDRYKDFVDDILDFEYDAIANHNWVNEGNWGAWLFSQEKLNSFTWIHNPTSRNVDRVDYINRLMGDKFHHCFRNEYEFVDYNFDHIFVCLSPQYIPQTHWHYFTMFMMAYEEYTGKDANVISNKKFENEIRFKKVTDEILYKRSNGR